MSWLNKIRNLLSGNNHSSAQGTLDPIYQKGWRTQTEGTLPNNKLVPILVVLHLDKDFLSVTVGTTTESVYVPVNPWSSGDGCYYLPTNIRLGSVGNCYLGHAKNKSSTKYLPLSLLIRSLSSSATTPRRTVDALLNPCFFMNLTVVILAMPSSRARATSSFH